MYFSISNWVFISVCSRWIFWYVLYYRVPFVRKTHLVLFRQAMRKKRALHYETKMAASESLIGFHMTSPKFKNIKRIIDSPEFLFLVLGQLKPYIFTKFYFERILRFLIECAWISNHLRDTAFTWHVDTYVTACDT